MAAWELSLQVSGGAGPVFHAIASSIARDIERGRLRPGERLSSSRALAMQLGVNRNTVIAAYNELHARGWISIEPARGTFVAARPPRRPEAPVRPVADDLVGAAPPPTFPTRAGFDLPDGVAADPPIARTPGLLLLLGGVPELRFLPQAQLARAYRTALRGAIGRRLIDYAPAQGSERLRTALAELLSRVRGIPAPVESICVVRGSQQGVYLAARALIRPGDAVAVEALGYRPAWRALELAGARLVPLPVDADGLDIGALEAACARGAVRAVYLTPHHHYPTTVTLSPERRARLLALARRERMVVLEDDYDFDFHYEGRPVLPLAAADSAGVVVYLGTMSKSLAPGLRVGYVVAAPEVVRRIAAYRTYVDIQGDQAIEHAIAVLLEDGVIQQHAARARRAYRLRRDALCEALGRLVPELVLTPPRGGMALWGWAPGIDTDAWAARGLTHGVAFQAERRFRLDGRPGDHVRMGFAACSEAELVEAARRAAAALRSP